MCRRLFAELEAGPRRSADPTSFAAGLQIDHTIQQDGQEFMKLLLDLLQRRYADADSRVRKTMRYWAGRSLSRHELPVGHVTVNSLRNSGSGMLTIISFESLAPQQVLQT